MTPDQIAPGTLVFDPVDGPRMRGRVAQSGNYFDAPLISHVEGNLYQGGCYEGIELAEGFKHVISLYPWEKYDLPKGCDREEIVMYDSLDQDMALIDEVAQKVVDALKDGPTLVHCQAGLNRSGLVAARALMLMGRSSDEAIKLLRDSRSPEVLSNPAFEAYLRSLDAQ